jgi:AraC-like DNA-binding protein
MRQPSLARGRSANRGTPRLGLFREELIGLVPARTTQNIFTNLQKVNRGELIGIDPERHLQGTRLHIDRTQGHGTWEFYRLEQDLFVVAADCVYDTARVETVPGEGLLEFHLRLSGHLQLNLPRWHEPLEIEGPRLLLLYQPPGCDAIEQVTPGRRDTCVSLYCRPQYLRDMVQRNNIAGWAVLEDIERHPGEEIWHRQLPLSSGLAYIARSLLENPFRRGIRLLHAEAKVLDLFCELLHDVDQQPAVDHVLSEGELVRLDVARNILSSKFSPAPRVSDIARAVGMSESKLKRVFKSRFGVTVFDYGLDCRMRSALNMLRSQHLSVGQVAYAVGYRHQTSFTAAFKDFFGFLPRDARTEVH